jgi:hypothetical protein
MNVAGCHQAVGISYMYPLVYVHGVRVIDVGDEGYVERQRQYRQHFAIVRPCQTPYALIAQGISLCRTVAGEAPSKPLYQKHLIIVKRLRRYSVVCLTDSYEINEPEGRPVNGTSTL